MSDESLQVEKILSIVKLKQLTTIGCCSTSTENIYSMHPVQQGDLMLHTQQHLT